MMAMEFCGREYNFPTHFGEVADTCGDLNIACPSCLLAHIAKLEARIAQLEAQRGANVLATCANCAQRGHCVHAKLGEACEDHIVQRGGAVVVPELTESDIDAIWRDVEDINDASRAMAAWAYRLAVSRIQPIPADRVLGEGMVGVDREELATLREIAGRWCPPFGVPHNMETVALFDRLRTQQAKGK